MIGITKNEPIAKVTVNYNGNYSAYNLDHKENCMLEIVQALLIWAMKIKSSLKIYL